MLLLQIQLLVVRLVQQSCSFPFCLVLTFLFLGNDSQFGRYRSPFGLLNFLIRLCIFQCCLRRGVVCTPFSCQLCMRVFGQGLVVVNPDLRNIVLDLIMLVIHLIANGSACVFLRLSSILSCGRLSKARVLLSMTIISAIRVSFLASI